MHNPDYRLKEFTCHLAAVKVGLTVGGAGDTWMCRRFCIGGEKSRLTPPNFNYTPKASLVRTFHREPPSPLVFISGPARSWKE